MSSGENLKIWGRTNSSNVMKVLWCCEELGLQFERVDVGGAFGGTQEPAYLAMNPNARVPTIEDNGLILWESNAIVRYLAATYGSPVLCPADRRQRWHAEQWMDWQQSTLQPDATTLFWQLVRTDADKRDAGAIEAARQGCASYWKIADGALAEQNFLAGPEFTMGDIPLGVHAYRWFNYEIERPPLPHLEAWYRRLGERSGYRKYVVQPMT